MDTMQLLTVWAYVDYKLKLEESYGATKMCCIHNLNPSDE